MKVGTKSLLIGVHQLIWHPITVYLAWCRLYGRPTLREVICIFIHDWGYWGSADMDGEWGINHPMLGAKIAGRLFGDDYYDFVLLHSQNLAMKRGAMPSKLCWADKASILFEPQWFYLFRAQASGELAEYRQKAARWVALNEPDRQWFRWLKRRLTKAAMDGERRRNQKNAPDRRIRYNNRVSQNAIHS
jgi:hypothetical protein